MKICLRRAGRACLLLALAAGMSGCSGHTEMKLVGDDMGAGGLMVHALEAWKSGDSPESMLQANPPVRVVDEDWNAGKKLNSYQVQGDPQENGSHWRVHVQIETQGADGKVTSEKVVYAVTLREPASILRSDFLE